jgi:hypothetical protein|tara:strand:+ start:3682 stop:3888 length:207 start_codon:yes stop_codon:yes gene_type:complete
MNHSIEDLIHRINLMHDKAMELHRVRNAKPDYDENLCMNIAADIRGIAYLIAKDNSNSEITSEIDPRK